MKRIENEAEGREDRTFGLKLISREMARKSQTARGSRTQASEHGDPQAAMKPKAERSREKEDGELFQRVFDIQIEKERVRRTRCFPTEKE